MTDILHLNRDPKDTRIIVAMSGGVDSSVAAALLVEAGYDVVGLTMQLYDHGETIQRKKACCAGLDIYDARTVAEKLGIPHYVLDYESRFKESVINEFVDSYLMGETPVPCVRCNQTVKFQDMYTMARDLGGHALVTGHYVQWQLGKAGPEMYRAVDPTKDQSYFLFATTPDQLSYIRFPLGGLSKTETRNHARRFNLRIAEKPDSQDICFVPDGNYARIVERLRPGALESGDIVSMNGEVLGKHTGIINYTVGQRKGLGISHSEPLYVVRLNPEKHQVIVGPKEALACKGVVLKDLNWLGESVSPNEAIAMTVKFRSSQEPFPATLIFKDKGYAEVIFKQPEYGVAPGQACVFYDDTRLLGGGWIVQPLSSFE